MSAARCPACGADRLEHFHTEARVPAHSCLLLASREEAQRYPTGAIDLAFCPDCGFITNTAFDITLNDYSPRYEETQAFSPRFRRFARELADEWVERYDLAGGRVVEIGCGKGEFLTMMCEAGVARGIGIDPGTRPERTDSAVAGRISWLRRLFRPGDGLYDADAVVCRHTLEHIHDVGRFLRGIRAAIGDRLDTVVLFELPDVRRVLDEVAFWDVYYEHCSYFSPGSLARLFRSCGFDVLDLRLAYDDQYILIEARPATEVDGAGAATSPPTSPLEDDLADLAAGVARFGASYRQTLDRWREEVGRAVERGERVVIWGAGSKGVAYLVGLGAAAGVDFAVDVNPYKQGMFLAGSGHAVVGPDHLAEHRPDLVVAMNPAYVEEIGEALAGMGLETRLVAVG